MRFILYLVSTSTRNFQSHSEIESARLFEFGGVIYGKTIYKN